MILFFEKLYGESTDSFRGLPSNLFPHFSDQDVNFFVKAMIDDEIQKALFDMAPLNFLESDGFHAHFFRGSGTLLEEPFVSGFEEYLLEITLNLNSTTH